MKTLILAATMALGLAAAPADPVAWKLVAPAAPVKAGAKFKMKLVATVSEGWHLYSLKPMSEGPIPTRIRLAEGQPFTLTGPVDAPEPRTVRDASFGMDVELYTGETEFVLPLKTAAGSAGAQKLVVTASYQSCNIQICLPAKTVKVEAPIAVK